ANRTLHLLSMSALAAQSTESSEWCASSAKAPARSTSTVISLHVPEPLIPKLTRSSSLPFPLQLGSSPANATSTAAVRSERSSSIRISSPLTGWFYRRDGRESRRVAPPRAVLHASAARARRETRTRDIRAARRECLLRQASVSA